MSPSPLHDALHEVAQQQAPVVVDPDTYRRGRRAHRRGVALTSLAAVAAVGAVTVGGVALVTDVGAARPEVAGGDAAEALPEHVYAVPGRLAPDGKASWDADLAVSTLAVGRLGVVYPVDSWSRSALVGVRAEDGAYVGLDLPGLSTASSAQFSDNPAALSADGDRLAYAWREPGRPQRSGLRVVDLESGEVTDHRLPSEHGVLVSGISWSPDESYLVYGRRTVTDPPSGVTGPRNYRVERLDLSTGERLTLPFAPGEDAASVNDAGDVAVPGVPAAVWRKGRNDRLEGIGTEAVSVAWAPDGRRVALGDSQGGAGVHDRRGTGVTGLEQAPDEPDLAQNVHVLGWIDDDEFAVRIDNVDQLLAVSDDGASTRELLTMDTEVVTPSVATDLLGVPTRDDPRPAWVRAWWDRATSSPTTVFVALGLGTVLVVVTASRRRRRLGLS